MTLPVKATSLEIAKTMADAAEAIACQKGLKIVIAIMDSHGNLKYFWCMGKNN